MGPGGASHCRPAATPAACPTLDRAVGNNAGMNIRIILAGGALALAGSFFLVTGTQAQTASQMQLPITTAVIAAGGGAGEGSFSSVRAIAQMVGGDALQNELRALRDKDGSDNVDRFVHVLDFAFIDGWKRAGQDNVKMPAATSDTGTALALDMIRAGTGSDGAFRTSTMMDTLWSPRVHAQIHDDIVARYGSDVAANFQRVGDQFFNDLARSLHQPTASPSLPKSEPALYAPFGKSMMA